MDIGIGLPNALRGVRGRHLVDWAVAAEGRGFSVLGTIGRVVFDTHEELVVFAAAAGVTRRIGLMSSVMIAPPRQAALLAKQAATLDHVAEGRFRLGIGTGWRADDYAVLGRPFQDRGAQLDDLLAALARTWDGEALDGAERPVGPAPYTPGGPPIVLGGGSEAALRRAGQRADVFLAGPAPAEQVADMYATVRAAADDAGREAPALQTARYFAIDASEEEVRANVEDYYAFGGPDVVGGVYDGVLRSPEQIRATLDELEKVGVEEVCLWPQSSDLGQVDALADALELQR